ncbi:HEPN domain-containing protein [Dysgonomonas sp. ZJ279]|uniref:HEPN domain-containing protein n=1 Tax=Dysgonomonas sp. ZJ279 TaxID=2709796 RepID=UPI0021071E0D|nr:HEPN domain-containing protein [Dysgonomonas sp. ZJ279]
MYFDDKFDKANDFFRSARHDIADEKYQMCSFHIHQACENYYYSIRLAFTLRSSTQQNLTKLAASIKGH